MQPTRHRLGADNPWKPHSPVSASHIEHVRWLKWTENTKWSPYVNPKFACIVLPKALPCHLTNTVHARLDRDHSATQNQY